MATVPFAPVEWLIAGRYLRAKKQEGFVSVITVISFIGTALGVAVLIVVMSVMNGFRHELLSRILGMKGHMQIESVARGGIRDYAAATERVRAVRGVIRAAPYVEAQVMASVAGQVTGAIVRGFSREDLASFEFITKNLSEGTLDRFDGPAVIIGRRLAQLLGVDVGMTITLIAPRGDVTIFGTIPRTKSYTIAGTFSVGMSEYDQAYIFMPLAEAQLYFNWRDAVPAIEVMVESPDAVEAWRDPIAAVSPEATRVVDWKQMHSSFFNALMVERTVMFFILTLIILIAALNTVSGLIMLVKDKGRGIAILRTMGATQGTLMRVFLIAGSSIGITGTALGLVLGILFATNIESVRQFIMEVTGANLFDPLVYFLSQLPSKIDPNEVIATALVAITISFLATLYPSWRASRVDPVEALRYE